MCYSSVDKVRYFKANNEYLPNYDPKHPSSYIMYMYLNANNLYGWAMSQSLLFAEFKWLTPTKLKRFTCTPKCISKLDPHSEIGYMLEVDLEYPRELHNSHNDYPLTQEDLVVPHKWFSEYQCELLDDHKDILKPNVNKLTCTLNLKRKYVVHYAMLQLYLKLGLKFSQVHRVMSFRQKPWMHLYIDNNTQLRTQANQTLLLSISLLLSITLMTCMPI